MGKKKKSVDEVECPTCHIGISKKSLRRHIDTIHLGLYKQAHQTDLVQCDKCDKTLTRKSLKRHVLQMHPIEQGGHQCPKCNIVLRSEIELSYHIKSKHEVTYYPCKYCNDPNRYPQIDENGEPKKIKQFRSKIELQNHMKRFHVTKTGFPCEICYKVFSTNDKFRVHMAEIHNRFGDYRVSCSICNMHCKSHVHLANHMDHSHAHKDEEDSDQDDDDHYSSQTHRDPKMDLYCDFCDKFLPDKARHSQHMNQVHTPISEHFKCQHCAEKLDCAESLQDHMDEMHPDSKRNNCLDCNKSFTHFSSLRRHVQLVHEDKTFGCEICGKKFKTLENMKYHVFNSHERNDDLTCKLCANNFVNRASLRVHISTIHYNIKNNYCRICNKGFSRKDHLRSHYKKIHPDEYIRQVEEQQIKRLGGKKANWTDESTGDDPVREGMMEDDEDNEDYKEDFDNFDYMAISGGDYDDSDCPTESIKQEDYSCSDCHKQSSDNPEEEFHTIVTFTPETVEYLRSVGVQLDQDGKLKV